MSDDPGNYAEDELQDLLSKYLGGNLWSAKRLKNIMLPFWKEKILLRLKIGGLNKYGVSLF